MADYESDSSDLDDIQTSVLLGYTSKEPTGDDFSQLGGHPTWLDDSYTPDGALAKCKVCNGYMSLLLQLNADLPERFPGHERRIYVWACRRKACRRKNESIRAFRGVRGTAVERKTTAIHHPSASPTSQTANTAPTTNLGETLFGVKSPSTTTANPFASSSSSSNAMINPFSSAPPTTQAPPVSSTIETLPQTFAEKVRISSAPDSSTSAPAKPKESWPDQAAFPSPFPQYHIDAESEYLESNPIDVPGNARVGGGTLESEGSNGGLDEKSLFESSMDKTFQRFADRLSQNSEQVLRYEYGGYALLYSRKDVVGKLLAAEQEASNTKVKVVSGGSGSTSSRIPRCTNCGAGRVFELQLTPHAILELEAEDMSIDGMDWGTIIVGVCSADCQEKSVDAGQVGYLEEWAGVQWEELAGKGR